MHSVLEPDIDAVVDTDGEVGVHGRLGDSYPSCRIRGNGRDDLRRREGEDVDVDYLSIVLQDGPELVGGDGAQARCIVRVAARCCVSCGSCLDPGIPTLDSVLKPDVDSVVTTDGEVGIHGCPSSSYPGCRTRGNGRD